MAQPESHQTAVATAPADSAASMHSPLPWWMGDAGAKGVRSAMAGRSRLVADTFGYTNTRDDEATERENAANAAFIVRACNSHHDLLAALKAMVSIYDGVRDALMCDVVPAKLAMADAAIAKAEGRP